MWKTLFRTVQFGDLGHLLSPAFFRVFPVAKMRRAVGELMSNYRDRATFEQVVDERRHRLQEADIPVELEPEATVGGDTRPSDGRQLLTVLELNRKRFGHRDESLVWAPGRVYVQWDEEFLDGVRTLYRGFYLERDEEFDAGLAKLGLEGMGDLFAAHFGGGEQRAVQFEMEHFHTSFEDILARAREEGRTLHYQFAPLGVYLATLYDHLDRLDGTYDVRSIAEKVLTP
ncbi:MAG: hypothetical protein ABEN55_13755 [Bradymonadaceae bacterium]